jgi:hypothetical protein
MTDGDRDRLAREQVGLDAVNLENRTAGTRFRWGRATCRDGVLSVNAQVTSLDGRLRVAGGLTAGGPSPEAVGASIALTLRERGAGAILDQIREPASRQPARAIQWLGRNGEETDSLLITMRI